MEIKSSGSSMSTNKDLVELLDSILQQVPEGFTRTRLKSASNASHAATDASAKTHADDTFDKVRTLDILVNNVLSVLQDNAILIKVFRTIQFLLARDHSVLIEPGSNLRYDTVVIPKLLPFLNCALFSEDVIVEAKLTILEVADLVINDRHAQNGYRNLKTFQNFSLRTLTTVVDQAFESLSTVKLDRLSIAVHLLQVLHDYKMNSMLMLEQFTFQFDTLVRKLWVVLSHYLSAVAAAQTAALAAQRNKLDNLASVLLLSMFSSFHKDDVPSTSKFSFLCSKLKELLNWQSLIYTTPRLQSTMARILLELLWKVAIQDQNHVSLRQALQIDSAAVVESHLRAFTTTAENVDEELDKNFAKVICICLYVFERLSAKAASPQSPAPNAGDTSISAAASNQLQSAIVSNSLSTLGDQDLEHLRQQILAHVNDDIHFSYDSHLHLTDGSKFIPFFTSSDRQELSSFVLQINNTLQNGTALSQLQKLYYLNALGTVSCITSGDYDFEAHLCARCDAQLNDSSYVNSIIDPNRPYIAYDPELQMVLDMILRLAGQGTSQEEPILVIAALLSLRKVFASYVPPKITGMQERVFKFISSCLLNDMREIRILATKVLPYYLVLDDDDAYETNFQFIISFLQQIRINQKLHLAESTIIAWGELAIVIGIDEKLILVLVKMIDFIGSENQFQSTIAFHQLQIVSSCKKKTPWQLLSPFLPHLSVIIVRQMKSKPMIINKICGLVGVPVDVFLARTQAYTLPHVLTYYKHDLIGEISLAIKVSKYELIKRNLPKIMAHLFTVESKINEAKILQILGNVNDNFKTQSLHELIGNHILTSWEVLKLYSPEFDNLDRIKSALEFIASVYTNVEDGDGTVFNQDKMLKNFFNRTILGIVQNFSESTYDLKGLQPYIEKLKSIWAIDCLILICGQDIVAALPQITACLQANLEIKHLHLETLYCLSKLAESLDQSTMFVMLDFILSLILQKWDQFNTKCKKSCKKLLIFVMRNNEPIFKQRYYHYFFSFSFNPDLITIYNDARTLFPSSAKSSSYNLLHDLTNRCNHENKYVVLQALDDLIHYFTKYQYEFHSNFVKLPTFIKYIPKLSSTLLNISYKFKAQDATVLHKCSVIYGLMGSLDFNKFYFATDVSDSSSSEQLVVINLFQEQNEVYRFLIQFINATLVPLFWASIDPVKQLFLAYAIQEYLKLLGLNGVQVESLEKNSTAYIIWNKFNRISQSTLLPLLNSRYSVNGSKDDATKYPIYKNYIKHSSWLREFTLDLLKKSTKGIGINSKGERIFHICSSIIKEQDLAICNHILPYVALNCVLVDQSIRNEVGCEILAVLKTDVDTLNDNSSIDSLKSCYQSIFSILDYFQKWCSSRKQKRKRQETAGKGAEMINLIEEFLQNFPQDLIAKRSAQCKSYERAILNLEESYRLSMIDKREFFSTIQSMYVEIDDLDSLDGVLKTFSTQSLNDKILQFQYSDDWKTAQDCYEALSEFDLENESLDNTTSLLKSLNKFNLYEHCLEKLDHVLMLRKNKTPPLEWTSLGLNSAIFTGNPVDISKWIHHFESNVDTTSLSDLRVLVNYELAKSLISLANGDYKFSTSHIDTAIRLAGDSLAASKQTSVSKTRDIVSQLHYLTDAKEIISNYQSESKLKSAIMTMDTRLANTSKDFQSNWQVLTMRRVLDQLHPLGFVKHDISNVWIKLAQTARQYSRLDLSRKAIMNALVLQDANKEVDLEFAQLLWAQDDHSRALKAIDELRAKTIDGSNFNREAATIQLIYTEWLDASDSGSSESIIEEYTMAAKLDSKWEKPYYCLGKYYNKILESQTMLNNDIKAEKDFYGDYEKGLVFNYLRAIKTGHTYVFEALPKVITIWLDFSATYGDINADFRSVEILTRRKRNYELMKQCVKDVIASTPKVYWYTVFSQLNSRMIHPKSEIQDIIVDLIAKITVEYPQQALWSVFAQSKSTLRQRSALGSNILKAVSSYDKTKTIVKSALLMFDSLLAVCMQEVTKKTAEMNLRDDFGFNHSITPCDALVVPLRENFEIKFPSSGMSAEKKFVNYPVGSKITIHRIDDRVKILTSMQKPRRLTIKGSDGGIYSILCKPHDDLRKDAKLMEVTTMIDKLLAKDEESELRKLSISTYAVVPLNETYGIIEWVDRCRTIRDIVLTYLASSGTPIDFNFCKKQLSDDKSPEEKIQGFNKIKEKYPAVFRLWFLEEFPDPKAWYMARNAFTRSSAVMSIVGHILGLGDRHMDNILVMEKTGGVLHVDFDCLFDKGLTLTVPERVPFRLTSNIVDAFGISGVEGIFRKSCEVTTRLIRHNETALMNILESFLYDPILDWSASKRRKKEGTHNPEVVLNNIKKKIRGIEKDTSLSLSVPANVDALITQATSTENLALMYIGWMGFL